MKYFIYLFISISAAKAEVYPNPSISIPPVSGKDFLSYYSSSKVLVILNTKINKFIQIKMPDRVIGIVSSAVGIIVYTLDGKILVFNSVGELTQNYEDVVKGLILSGADTKENDRIAFLVSLHSSGKGKELRSEVWFVKFGKEKLQIEKSDRKFGFGKLNYSYNQLWFLAKGVAQEITIPN